MKLEFTKKNINNWIKLMFQILIPLFLFWFIESIVWYLGGIIGWAIHPTNYYFEPFTIDRYIPVISWMLIFYAPASALWILGPVFIYLIKGPKNYYKFLSVSIVVMFFTLIIFIIYPTYSYNLAQLGKEQLWTNKDHWNFFDEKMYNLLSNGLYYSAFPSNHVSCTWLVVLGFIFCVNDSKTKEFKPQVKTKKPIYEIVKIIFVIYACLVTFSTFLLKQHFFVDWIGSILITFSVYFLFVYQPDADFLSKPLTKFFNSLYFVSSFIDSDWKIYDDKNIYSWAKKSRKVIDTHLIKERKWVLVKYFPHVLTIGICIAGIIIPFNLAVNHA